jgi:hypothetical protein
VCGGWKPGRARVRLIGRSANTVCLALAAAGACAAAVPSAIGAAQVDRGLEATAPCAPRAGPNGPNDVTAECSMPATTEPQTSEAPRRLAQLEGNPAPATGAESAIATGGFVWTLAPIRWDGNVAEEIRRSTFTGQPNRLQQVEIANLRAGSYLWEPWFAQLTGGLGFVASKERASEAEGSTSPTAPSSNSDTITGSAGLSVFPLSRFPFYASYDRSDSRASGELSVSDFVSTRYGVRQNYRTPEGGANYTLSFDRSTLDSPSFGQDTLDVLSAGAAFNAGPQRFDFSGSRSHNLRADTQEQSTLDRLLARHSYRPDALLSTDSLASWSTTNFRILAGGAEVDSRSKFVQANTFSTWRPEAGSPWYVTGGGRFFRVSTDAGGSQVDSDTLSGNVALSYLYDRHTTISGGAALTRTSAETADSLVSSESGAAVYVPDPVPVGNFTYTRNVGVNAANQNGGVDGNRRNGGIQAGHNLTRTTVLGESASVTYAVGRAGRRPHDTVTGNSETLAHNTSVTWQLAPGPSSTAFFSLSGADSRTRGYNENHFQLFNLQANGQVQLSQHASGGANLTAQAIRQTTPAAPDGGFTHYSSGSVRFQHAKAFDVPRLRYIASYNVNQSQLASRFQGDLGAPRDRVSQSFEQIFDYAVGRLELRILARSATIEGQHSTLVFFRISRQFGTY